MPYEYTDYAKENAFKALPYLVYAAEKGVLRTYGDVAKDIGVLNPRNMSKILGYIRDEICIKRSLPLLSTIVINKRTRLPGDDYLPEGTNSLSKIEYRQKFEEMRNKVFSYNKWDTLLKEFGINPVERY